MKLKINQHGHLCNALGLMVYRECFMDTSKSALIESDTRVVLEHTKATLDRKDAVTEHWKARAYAAGYAPVHRIKVVAGKKTGRIRSIYEASPFMSTPAGRFLYCLGTLGIKVTALKVEPDNTVRFLVHSGLPELSDDLEESVALLQTQIVECAKRLGRVRVSTISTEEEVVDQKLRHTFQIRRLDDQTALGFEVECFKLLDKDLWAHHHSEELLSANPE